MENVSQLKRKKERWLICQMLVILLSLSCLSSSPLLSSLWGGTKTRGEETRMYKLGNRIEVEFLAFSYSAY